MDEGERLATRQGDLEQQLKRLRGELKDAGMERDLCVGRGHCSLYFTYTSRMLPILAVCYLY